MTDLQASIDFSIELGTFYNIDLFQRGHYQIRVGLKSLTNRTPYKVTCHPPKNNRRATESVLPATVIQGIAVSQTFPIMYKSEDLLLNDVFQFTVQLLVDCQKIDEGIERAELKLIVELWFDEEYTADSEDKFEVVSTRIYDIHYTQGCGIHLHMPVIFDYFHLSAICVTVHAALIALHQPIYNPKNPSADWPLKNGQMSTLEAVLFSSIPPPNHAYPHIRLPRLRAANHMFRLICRSLQTSHALLQQSLQKLVKRIPRNRITEPQYKDCEAELETLCSFMETQNNEEEFLSYATSKIAHLCAYNVVLWQNYIDLFTYNTRANKVMAKEYHLTRVKRFSESFFSQEWQKRDVLNVFEPSKNGHSDLTAIVRNSRYFTNPLPLSLTSTESDGDHSNLPIIFEDVYKDEQPNGIVLSVSSAENSTWDISSLADEDSATSSPKVQQRPKHAQQIIKHAMPSINRPSKAYSMMECDLDKKEEKELKSSANPQLLGFKRISVDSETEPYELGCLSPAQERRLIWETNSENETESATTLTRKKSLLISNERRKRRGLANDRRKSDPTDSESTSDNFSLIISDASSLKSGFSGSSSSSTEVNSNATSSPKSERSFRLKPRDKGARSNSPSPLFKRANSMRKKKVQADRPASAVPLTMTKSETVERLSDITLNIPAPGSNTDSNTQMPASHSESQLASKMDQSHSPLRVNGESKKDLLVQPVSAKVIDYLTQKEKLKSRLAYSGHLYSDFAQLASEGPYFWPSSRSQDQSTHLIICVHGLEGNSQDLRLIRQYMELALPGEKLDFLMSQSNVDTFTNFETMADLLSDEIQEYLARMSCEPEKISFVAHSLGNVIVRAALTIPSLRDAIKTKLYTYLSLSGPHLGTIFSDSGLVNMAMWVLQKWKKTGSVIQLALKDTSNPHESFMYNLSKAPGLEYFKNVLLVSSMQDKYVPYHSARIEICKAAVRESSATGKTYVEMVHNILQPLIDKPDLTLVRYDTFYTLPTNTHSMIGRAAHIAVLDSELFLEKLLLVSASKYFK